VSATPFDPDKKFHHRFRAMGSPCEIILESEQGNDSSAIVTLLEKELQRLEQKYSRFLPDSLTTRINQSAGSGKSIDIDEETGKLLDYANTCYEQSDGLFDITSGSLRTIWNYHDLGEKQVLPDDEVIRKGLEKVGWQKIERKPESICLPVAGMEIDFGGIVKEYAADCVAAIAEAKGNGPGMVELGGDIRLFGNTGGKSRQVGIRNPLDTASNKPVAFIKMVQGGLATSGDYERYTLIQGKKYSHILNPLTGWPVEGFSSVSVLADQCVVAGSAASIAVLKGEKGIDWLEALGLPFLCIDKKGQVSGTLI